MKVIDSTLSLIGNTPLKRLTKVTDGAEADVLVKCEYFNPSGSIKDRMALRMRARAHRVTPYSGRVSALTVDPVTGFVDVGADPRGGGGLAKEG